MTLVAGREIANGGIPDRETLTVLAAGREWIDQQWLGQVPALRRRACGRTRPRSACSPASSSPGPTPRRWRRPPARRLVPLDVPRHRRLLLHRTVVVAGPGSDAGAAALRLDALPRRRPRAKALTADPARPTTPSALGEHSRLGRARSRNRLARARLGRCAAGTRRAGDREGGRARAGGWVCALATPYGISIVDYYHLLLVDPPFGNAIVEWERTRPRGITVVFIAVSALTVALLAWKRRRLTWFELVVLGNPVCRRPRGDSRDHLVRTGSRGARP